MTKPKTLQEMLDEALEENKQIRIELRAAQSTLDLHNRYVGRMIKYWKDQTGCEMFAPTILEASEHLMRYCAKTEALEQEVDELTEKIDEISAANYWLTQRLGNYE